MGLSKELMERIISNLGLGTIGLGVTSPENVLNKKLKLEEEDGSVKEYTVYAAECHVTSPPLRLVTSDIGLESNDVTVVIEQEETLIVLKYSFSKHDQGTFFTRFNEKWVDMTTLAQLNLTTATEMITQEGIPWTPTADPDYMFSLIASILSEGEIV